MKPPSELLAPEALHRVSRLLDQRKQKVTYDLCGDQSLVPQVPTTAKLANHVRDAVDALDLIAEPTSLRARSVGDRLLEALPPANSTLDEASRLRVERAAKIIAGKREVEEPAQTRPVTPERARPKVVELPPAADPRIELYQSVLTLEGSLRTTLGAQKGCDEECVVYGVRNCGRALAAPVEERVPATGGVAWTVRPLRDLTSDATRSDVTRSSWLFRRFDQMCEAKRGFLPEHPSNAFPESCRIARMYGRPTTSFPGVLFAAAVRADLESLPSKLGSPKAGRVDQLLHALMRRVRTGDTPLALLAGLSHAFERTENDSEAVVFEAARLISLLGDVLTVGDLSELERTLPILSAQVTKYWPFVSPKPTVTFSDTQVSRVARNVYVLNRLAENPGGSGERETAELGYQQLSAMLNTLDVAVDAVIEAKELAAAVLPADTQLPKGAADAKDVWKHSVAAAQAGALMLAGRYPEGALALTRPDVYGLNRMATDVNAMVPLAVAVATQQTPSGVASAIDSTAQRATIQNLRTDRVQLSFSGQFGVALTFDFPSSGGREGVGWTSVFGLTVPVGVGLSVPIESTYLSFQITMLDAGQLAALPLLPPKRGVRVGTEERRVVAVPTTKLRPEQFLAPGFYFGVAVPDSAILLAAGVVAGPRLREYETRSLHGARLGAEQFTVVRLAAKMVVDLPFLEFF